MSQAQSTSYDTLSIKIDGTALTEAVMDSLEEVVVEDDLAQPGMFTLRFNDPEAELIDSATINLGKEIIIAVAKGTGQAKTLMVGEVTALEPEWSQGRTLLTVRGYDKAHRLYRGRKTRTFLNMKDSDMVRKVAQEAGLSADIEATSNTHVYMMQNNQTDMDFLRARALRVGYRVVVEGSKLKFRKPETSPPEAPEQELGLGLLSFDVRLTAAIQPNSVEVRGWDGKAKKAIVGTASTAALPSKLGYGKNGGQAAKSSFGAAKVTITDQVVGTQSEATTMAQALLNELSGEDLSVEGVCFGDPAIKAGVLVPVKGVGTRFGGKYFVTATRHEYRYHETYTTTFYTSGHRPSSVLGMLHGERTGQITSGVVPAVVTNIKDPDKLGRVKLKFPWLNDDEESDWARLATPGAGSGRGFFSLPEVNDEVLVAFEHGDINRPYVIGGLWNNTDKPSLAAVVDDQGAVKLRTFKTRVGHMLQFDDGDTAGKGTITIETASGNSISIGLQCNQLPLCSGL